MMYRLRERKPKSDSQLPSLDNSDEETDNDSRYSDPDYETETTNTAWRNPVRRAASLTGEAGLTEVGEGNSSSMNANLEWNVRKRRSSYVVQYCSSCVCKYCKDGGGELLDCTHCKKKYHLKCFVERKELDLNCKDCSSFCGRDCREEGNASVPALPDLNLDPSEEIGGVWDANKTPTVMTKK